MSPQANLPIDNACDAAESIEQFETEQFAYAGQFAIKVTATGALLRGGGVVAPRPRLYATAAAATEAATAAGREFYTPVKLVAARLRAERRERHKQPPAAESAAAEPPGQPESKPAAAIPATAQPPRLKCISIRQPHAEAILTGIKQVEYRSRPNNVTGPIYIYASNTLDRDCADEYGMTEVEAAAFPRGCIVGIVDIEPSPDGDWPLDRPRRLPNNATFEPTSRQNPVWSSPWPEAGPIPPAAMAMGAAILKLIEE